MIPVVYIHSGAQNYLRCAIESARKLNSEVVLLGNEANKSFSNQWFDMDELAGERYEAFKKTYVHMSTNPYEFELVCFKRYFSLLAYMEREKVERCVMVDSDILTYCSYDDIECFRKYDFVASIPLNQNEFDWCVGPQVLGITYEALKDLVTYIEVMYTQHLNVLEQKYDYHRNEHIKGGICDMSILYLWAKDSQYTVFNLLKHDVLYFDNSIQSKEERNGLTTKMNKILGIKKINCVDGRLSVQMENGSCIPAATLHFQGSAKAIMLDVYHENAKFLMLCHRYIEYGNRVIKKIRGKLK